MQIYNFAKNLQNIIICFFRNECLGIFAKIVPAICSSFFLVQKKNEKKSYLRLSGLFNEDCVFLEWLAF